MKRTATMVSQVEQYLALRRRLGFELRTAGAQLLAFARFADASGHRGPISLDLAVRWARSSERARPITWADRLGLLRPFAKYRLRFDAATQIPPLRLLGPGYCRLVPHIYTAGEIASLLQAANGLSPKEGLRPVTYQTLFGLIAATGLRVSEARSLTRADVDFTRGVLTARNTKFRKSRLVPLHRTSVRALKRYAEIRDRKVPLVHTAAFFVSDRGKPLDKRTVHYTFAKLRQHLGWVARGGHPAPRIHDLRHTFICQALLRGYRKRPAFEHDIAALSTYVGHAKVTDIYWYVTGIPELMALAARRFERFAHGDSR